MYYIGFLAGPEGWNHQNFISKRGTVLAKIYLNDEFADTLDAAAAHPDREERRRLIHKVAEIVNEDPFMIFLFAPDNLTAHRIELKGWDPDPTDQIYVDNLYK